MATRQRVLVPDQDRRGARELRQPYQQQADRPAADDADAVADSQVSEIDGVHGDAQRLEQRHGRLAHGRGHGEAVAPLDEHLVAQRAVIGPHAVEVVVRTEVRVALLALAALAAGDRGIDGDAGARDQRRAQPVDRARRRLDDDAAEFVAEDQRRLDDRIADPPGFIHVQIGAAHADAADADPRLPGARRRERRRRPEPQIARRVQPDRVHPWKPRARA